MRVTVCDVGPRDGLQNEPERLAPDVRAELVRRLAAAGVPRIEAVSFVHPERVPQMAGAEEVVAAAGEVEAELSGLVLNPRGWERFAATTLDRVNVTLAATESFNQRNGNASLADATARVEEILRAADRPATATISCSFGCPFEGEVDGGVVLDLAERLAAAGAEEIVLADTIGVATPGKVRSLVESLCSRNTKSRRRRPLPRHAEHGRRERLDRARVRARPCSTPSVGGLGGCPFAPNSTGNVATEDVLYLLDREGVETGVDLDGVIATARWLEERARPRAPGPRLARRRLPLRQLEHAVRWRDERRAEEDEYEEELPAWSLPANVLDAIRIPPTWPERVDRDWACGGATGAGVRVAIVDSGVERGHPLVGEVERGGRRLRTSGGGAGNRARTRKGDTVGHGTACAGIVRSLAPECSLVQRARARRRLDGQRPAARRRPALGDRAGHRGRQHEPLDDEARARGRAARARRRRVLQPDAARGRRAQHARRELSMAVLVGRCRSAATSSKTRWRTSTTRHRRSSSSPAASRSSVPWLGGSTVRSTGNSFATPHMTGMCALIRSKHPELTPFQVKSVLYLTANNVGGNHDRDESFATSSPPVSSSAEAGQRELLQSIVEVARAIFGAQASSIFLLDERRRRARLRGRRRARARRR